MPRLGYCAIGVICLIAAVPTVARTQTIPAPLPNAEPLLAPTTSELSLDSLEQLALEHNPTLVQAGAQVRISRGKALQAGLYPNPSVGYVAEQIGAEGTAGELQGMFLEQEFVTGGKLQLSRAKFAQEAKQAELQVLAQQYRVLSDVRAAFYNALTEQRRLESQQQVVALAREVSRTVEELVNVGQANRPDLLQAQLEVQRADANLRTVQQRYQGSLEELAALVGLPELAQVRLIGELEFGEEATLDRETAFANLLAHSPLLRVAQAEVARDQLALQREIVEPIPNLNLRATTGYNLEAQDTVAGVELGLEIPIFDRNQGTIAQARAELARAQADVRRLELSLRRRFAQTYTQYETAQLAARTYREQVLPKAEEIYQLYLESFQQRRAAWPQVLDAQRTYFESFAQYLDYLRDARLALVRVDSLLLEDGLSQPPTPTPEGHRDVTPRPR